MDRDNFLNFLLDELSQPICASNLNIQFLKIKLDKGELLAEINKEVLESIEADLQRLIEIVKKIRIQNLIRLDS